MSVTCICGSDLWPYRGLNPAGPAPMGHEYGIVEEVGRCVTSIKRGQFVIGSFAASDLARTVAPGITRRAHREWITGAQAPLRVPMADGTFADGGGPSRADLVPSFLAVSDVLALAGLPLMPRR